MRRRTRKDWGTGQLVLVGLGALAGFAVLTWLLEPKTRVTVVPANEPLNLNLKGVISP